MCEMRLDNVVYRLGIAPTRRAARKLLIISINVNGKNCNIPSHELKLVMRFRSRKIYIITSY